MSEHEQTVPTSPSHGQQGLLDTLEAAAHCRSSASKFNKLRMTGGGPVYIRIGRKILYDVADLNAWMRSRKFTSTAEYTSSAA